MTDMKISKEREDFKGMGAKELKTKIDSLRRELFSLRLNASTAHVKDYSQFNKLRKKIARGSTILNDKKRDEQILEVSDGR